MHEYEALHKFNSQLPSGTVMKLTSDQLRRRKGKMEEIEAGLHRSTDQVHFKLGEKIELEDALDMRMYGKLFQSMSVVKTEGMEKKEEEKKEPKKKKKGLLG